MRSGEAITASRGRPVATGVLGCADSRQGHEERHAHAQAEREAPSGGTPPPLPGV